ncbi:MAG: hypothetical protein GXX79_01310 [Actinomycetales bacterium]|nr:hypothetical protein [Actinomycetales bacterium]
MSVPLGSRNDRVLMSRFAELSRRARSKGIHLDALGGSPSWAAYPSRAESWAKEVRDLGFFERIHLDIEPYTLGDWTTRQKRLSSGLVQAVQRVRSVGLPVDVDIPHWYWKTPTLSKDTLDIAVMRRADSVTIMAYQNTWSRIVAVSAVELRHAAALGKRAVIGVNIRPASATEPTSTLWGATAVSVFTDLARITSTGTTMPGFGGVALHDAEYLARLQTLSTRPRAVSTPADSGHRRVMS